MTAEEIAALRRQRYNASVVYLAKPNPELMIIRVRPDFPRPIHDPGQYTTLGLGHWEPRFPGCQEENLKPGDEAKVVRRAYSISCSVLNEENQLLELEKTDWVEFYVVLVKVGSNPDKPPALTPRLFMLRSGDRIQLGEKFTGHFTLEGVRPTDTVLFLSTGTGEAPHNYMLWQLLRNNHAGRILAACCVRYNQDLAYLPIHRQLESMFSNYTFLGLTTREPHQAGRKVYIQDLLTSGQLEEAVGHSLDPNATHVYLCGNPNMIGVPSKDATTGERAFPQPPGVIEIMEKRGFQCDNAAAKVRGNIHYEEYW